MVAEYSKLFQLFLLIATIFNVEAQVFDVTKFGAREGSDATQAITAAWKKGCASASPSTILIPKGSYNVKNLNLEGPCKAAIRIQLQGILKAPADVKKQIKGDNWITIQHVQNFILNGGGSIDGNGKTVWAQKEAGRLDFLQPTNLGLNDITNAMVQDISSIDSKMFHISVLGSNNVTLRRVTTLAPGDSPNTDGIHIARSHGVQVLKSVMKTGDDCVSFGDGSQQVFVTGAICGPGHGISIGSLGKYKNEEPVRGIFVKNCTLANTLYGVRVKTFEDSPVGEASDIHFEGINMQNVDNPILIDQEYCPDGNCPSKKAPSRVKISNVLFRDIKGTSSTKDAVKLLCSKSNRCEDVEIIDVDLTYNGPEGGRAISICSNVEPRFSGRVNPSGCTSHVQAYWPPTYFY